MFPQRNQDGILSMPAVARSESAPFGQNLRWRSLFVAAVALFLAIRPGSAQTISSTLLGTVTDPSGTVVPKANVVAINESTNDERSTTTDGSGNFSFPSLL